MQNKFLFLFCLFTGYCFNIHAQEYPFPQGSAVWKYLARPWDSGMQGVPYYVNYEMSGDTVIDGKHYHFLSKHWGDYCEGDDDFPFDFIRTEGQKVFYLRGGTLEEVVLYDFGLEVGDFFYTGDLCGFHIPDSMEVTFLDSVMIDGNYRKCWHFGYGDQVKWIEGIGWAGGYGTMVAPFYTDEILLDGIRYDLLCFTDNGEEIISDTATYHPQPWEYTEIYYYTCNGVLDNLVDLQEEWSLDIFPNPFFEDVSISFEEFEKIQQLNLYSVSGKWLRSLPLQNTQDLSQLPPGVYFIQVMLDGKLVSRRIVKSE